MGIFEILDENCRKTAKPKKLKFGLSSSMRKVNTVKKFQRYSFTFSRGAGLFWGSVCIEPIVAYGIRSIWSELTDVHFEKINAVVWAFRKRVLGLPRTTRNRYVAKLTGQPSLPELMEKRYGLTRTTALRTFLSNWEDKMETVDQGLYESQFLESKKWTMPNSKLRWYYAAEACNNLHNVYCRLEFFHLEYTEECLCRFCDKKCEAYHNRSCTVQLSPCVVKKIWAENLII